MYQFNFRETEKPFERKLVGMVFKFQIKKFWNNDRHNNPCLFNHIRKNNLFCRILTFQYWKHFQDRLLWECKYSKDYTYTQRSLNKNFRPYNRMLQMLKIKINAILRQNLSPLNNFKTITKNTYENETLIFKQLSIA